MDIDAPLQGNSALSEFGLAYPLPLRIVALSAFTALGFASNLHILSALGIDTAQVLDVRLDSHAPSHLPSSRGAPPPGAPPPYVHPSKLYPPLYTLGTLALAWTALGWLLHSKLTHGDIHAVVAWRGLPVFVAAVVCIALCWPGNALCRTERFRFLRALRRIVSPSLNAAVPFCDIILADILTSSAKVLGDVWLAGCLVLNGEGAAGVAGDECRRVWGVPFMTSLPYLFRFRQCLSEVYTRSTPTPQRSLLNALKYATAFPVIIFSAMQTVIGDPFDGDEEPHEAGERWIGRTTLFYLWLAAVLINSMYSFWWDVTNDWGLSLLTRSGWSSSPSVSYAFIHPPPHAQHGASLRHAPPPSRATSSTHTPAHSRARSLLTPQAYAPGASTLAVPGAEDALLPSTTFPPAPSRPVTPTPSSPKPSSLLPSSAAGGPRGLGHSRAFSTASAPNLSYPFLRPILLLPSPALYYLAIVLDLLLRLTWSLKLSSHLHSAQEVESGVFAVEFLEVARRWMWVYLRVEWEAVRKGAGSDSAAHAHAGAMGVSWLEKDDGEERLRAQEEYELARREAAAAGGGGGGGGGGKGKARADLAAEEEAAMGLLNGAGRARDADLL
ncbi:protein-ER retention protein [Rhodotorula kratochvilovae]